MFKTAMSVLSEIYYCPDPSSEMVEFEMPIYARSPPLWPVIIFVRTGGTGVNFLLTA